MFNQFSPTGSRRFTRVLRTALASSNAIPNAELSTYRHMEVERKWQKYWDDNKSFKTTRILGKPKRYVLDMFPYPSGAGLHVGHPEGYTATDIMSRYWRMLGYDVLHPMGWDAFGLPAEQHAINTGTHPSVTTYKNIETFKRQLKSLGFSYDWDRELATTDDGYVRWTQWIFLQLFKSGLATQSEVSVNWCPALGTDPPSYYVLCYFSVIIGLFCYVGTVLANEEVINGLSERGNHPVVRQPLRQWVLKITQYADKLEEGLASLDWPEGTMSAQKQWIGRSTGASVTFTVDGYVNEKIEVFTTRPDTLLGATYLVLAPEHPSVSKLITNEQRAAVSTYLATTSSKTDLERTSTGKDKGKTGVMLGSFAINPISGEKIPVYVADYVLMGYGTGAVMGVPAHDDRDFEFAKMFGLLIKQVVSASIDNDVLPMISNGIACNSGEFNGLTTEQCKKAVISRLKQLGAGEERVTYKLRDWVFSRQRYWGEPIPIYFPVTMLTADGRGDPRKDAHEIMYHLPIPLDETELPLKLPELSNFEPGDDPQGCLARATDWRYFQRDGKWYARETNTMPQWAGSCWYYMRFTDPLNSNAIFGPEAASWLPVDLYVGGQEHAVLHLLYARFWHKVLFDLGVVNHPEPFLKLVHQGMILGADGEKMSKSKGNVINPDDVVNEHGADVLRLYEMFMGPLEATKPWQTSQLIGIVRFRDRVYNLFKDPPSNNPPTGTVLKDMHKTIKKVTGDIESMSFNTAISQMMIFTNTLRDIPAAQRPKEALESLICLLSPFAPHIAEECWEILGHKDSISTAKWPTFDDKLCIETRMTIAVQVSGKVRATIDIEASSTEAQVQESAFQQASVKKYTEGASIKKVIYIPGKVINIVLGK